MGRNKYSAPRSLRGVRSTRYEERREYFGSAQELSDKLLV